MAVKIGDIVVSAIYRNARHRLLCTDKVPTRLVYSGCIRQDRWRLKYDMCCAVYGRYNERAIQVLSMIEEAESSVARGIAVPRGNLRVSSSNAFGARHLGLAITEYLKQYPGVHVDVTLNDRVVDLIEEGFDLAIRVAPKIDPGLIARKLGRSRLIVCASPDYLKKNGVPKVPEDLVRHHCLTYAYVHSPNEWRFRQNGVERKVLVSGGLRANSGDILRNAATENLGVTLQPDFLVFEALRDGNLVRILADWETDELGIFAVYPNRKFLPPKVRNFIDFLVKRFSREPYWSEHTQDQQS